MDTISNRNAFTFLKLDLSKKVLESLSRGATIAVPLCPDYASGGIGDGVSPLMRSSVSAAVEISQNYPGTVFQFLIADTEKDILRAFPKANIQSSAQKLQALCDQAGLDSRVVLFSDVFPDWHKDQYAREDDVSREILNNPELQRFLSIHEEKRALKYSKQYGKEFGPEDTRALQIRHYAQYLTLADTLIARGVDILMNYQTENLRAVSRHHEFGSTQKRIGIIVY